MADRQDSPLRTGEDDTSLDQQAEPVSEFPKFIDGDVKIVISGSRQYHLHSNILKNASFRFRHLLSASNVAVLSSKALKKGVVIRSRVDWKDVLDKSGELSVELHPVPLDSEGRPTIQSPPQYPRYARYASFDFESATHSYPIYEAFDKVFGAIYQRPMKFGAGVGSTPRGVLESAFEVIKIAEWLDVVHVVNKPIEVALMEHSEALYSAIHDQPGPWVDFGYRIQSRIIYKEAMIHAVGQSRTPAMLKFLKDPTKDTVSKVTITAKAAELGQQIQQVQTYMLTHYPEHLLRTRDPENTESLTRNSYSNDITTWQAVVVIRHWITQNLIADQTHHAKDMGFSVMQPLARGGDNYLTRKELDDAFHRAFPMTNKGAKTLQMRLLELKETMRQFASPLMISRCRFIFRGKGAENTQRYFTCVIVGDGDFPWEERKGMREADPIKYAHRFGFDMGKSGDTEKF